ncbi:hypothetical protein DEU56DRAFT_448833 [Suillus clintonianus]|uniref:uncharacterized protein n=1 Tax=Suillus clintonianus TaxID=1904413 RepID=UPI001B87C511|nr:uncharacterized protein DEU56DRAFT_448833 [Suillus clintonianus]KAG2132087.1 hypothetical protein DEU56DRAFT_448833 [Suillus clintonianus]
MPISIPSFRNMLVSNVLFWLLILHNGCVAEIFCTVSVRWGVQRTRAPSASISNYGILEFTLFMIKLLFYFSAGRPELSMTAASPFNYLKILRITNRSLKCSCARTVMYICP